MKYTDNMIVYCLKNGLGQIKEINEDANGKVFILVHFPDKIDVYREDGYIVAETELSIPHLYPIEKYLKIKTICFE